ncbi:metalloregulator ArsR/SmtB family transcription factor [Fundidesulfovibrio butyratiphilus]
MNVPAVFKALADETRLRLVRLLARHELNVGEIVAALAMGQSRVSRHLRILVECGLLRVRRDGLWAFYAPAQSGRASELLAALAPFLQDLDHGQDLDRAAQVMALRAQETRRFFNAVAGRWPDMRREVLGGLDLEGLLMDRVPTCAVAVDLGCGPGGLVAALARKAERVIGVDASSAMLERARETNPGHAVSLRVGELEHLPLADAEAEAAVLSLTLHHLSDPGAALVEAGRVLAPGGVLVVADYLKHDNEDLRKRYGDRWLGFSPEELSDWLGRAGLRPEKTDHIPVNMGLTLGVTVARRPNHPTWKENP